MSKIKREIVDLILPSIKKVIKATLQYLSKKNKKKYAAKVEAVGSYRRSAKLIGDLDILITMVPTEPIFMQTLFALCKKIGILRETISVGDTKGTGTFIFGKTRKVIIQIDFLTTTPAQYPFALLYFTGSKGHNIMMRAHAKKMGVSLNEYGFKSQKTGEYIQKTNAKIKSERDIFAILKLPYVKPSDRFVPRIDNATMAKTV